MKFSQNPIGTLEELREAGIDERRNGSCAARVGPSNGAPLIMGCPFYSPTRKGVAKCTLPCKGKGPENVKVRTLKSNGRRLERSMPCFEFYQHVFPENRAEGGNISRVVGIAGPDKELTYTARETQPKKHVGHNNTIKVLHEHVVVTRKIEPFVRPKDNPNYRESLADVKIREMEEADRVDAAWRERMGGDSGRDAFLSENFVGEPDETAEPSD